MAFICTFVWCSWISHDVRVMISGYLLVPLSSEKGGYLYLCSYQLASRATRMLSHKLQIEWAPGIDFIFSRKTCLETSKKILSGSTNTDEAASFTIFSCWHQCGWIDYFIFYGYGSSFVRFVYFVTFWLFWVNLMLKQNLFSSLWNYF